MPVRTSRRRRVVRDCRRREWLIGRTRISCGSLWESIVAFVHLGMFLYPQPSQLHISARSIVTTGQTRLPGYFRRGGLRLSNPGLRSVAAFREFSLSSVGEVDCGEDSSFGGHWSLLFCIAVFAGNRYVFRNPMPHLLLHSARFFKRSSLDVGIRRVGSYRCPCSAGRIDWRAIARPSLDPAHIIRVSGRHFFQVNNEVIYQTFYVFRLYFAAQLGATEYRSAS